MKNKNKLILLAGLLMFLILLAGSSSADVSFGTPVVSGYSSSALETGATFTVDILYTPPADAVIDSLELDVMYDAAILENPVVVDKGSDADVDSDLSGKNIDTGTPGKIIFQKFIIPPGDNGLQVTQSLPVIIFTISFHIKQNQNQNQVNNFNPPDKKLIWWREPLADYIYLKEKSVDKTGTPKNSAYSITPKYSPTFTGLNGVWDGDSWTSNHKVGNTLSLNWITNGGKASDLSNNGDKTHYPDGKLRYNIYRKGVAAGSPAPSAPEILQQAPIATAVLSGGATNTDYTFRDSGLNDVTTTYYYLVRAQDDCSLTHNESATTYFIPRTPHDSIPPEWNNAAIMVSAADQALTLNWTKPENDSNDLDGFIILRQGPFDTPQTLFPPTPVNAIGEEHGKNYTIGDNLDNWKVIKTASDKDGNVFDDDSNKGLTNGKYYYYAIYAYDHASPPGETPFQQGRNYSTTPITGFGVPGVSPSFITNFYAISRDKEKDIKLIWDNPSDDPNKPFGGTVVWYSTDALAKWSNIPDNPNDWAKAIADGKMKLFTNLEAQTPLPQTLAKEADGTDLDITQTYFLKAFAYNAGSPLNPNDQASINAHQFASPALAAAAPTLASGKPAVPDVSGLAIEIPNPAQPKQVKISWAPVDTKLNFYASPDKPESSYQPVKDLAGNVIEVDGNAGQVLLDTNTPNNYYRVAAAGKAPVGAANGTTPSETVARVTYTLYPGINTLSLYYYKSPALGGVSKKSIIYASDLIEEIQAQNGNTADITVFGYWDNKEHASKGYLLSYNNDGTLDLTKIQKTDKTLPDLNNFNLTEIFNAPYTIQISVDKNPTKKELPFVLTYQL